MTATILPFRAKTGPAEHALIVEALQALAASPTTPPDKRIAAAALATKLET